ncbi:MAG: extracellular solute-binding protein [Lachnospiraceae bacterium]|nr:extracellular solute-binding protein [Lachnospiraceae bacterium]
MRRKLALIMAGILVIGMLAGCKGGDKSGDNNAGLNGESEIVPEFKTYEMETIDMGDVMNNNTSISNIAYKDGTLYYILNSYADYPDEFYEEIEELDKLMYGDMDASDMAKDNELPEDVDKDVSDKEASQSEDGDGDKPVSNDEISDDELLGDLDDIFGDDSGNEDADDNKDEEDASDDDSPMTEEEYNQKYDEIVAKYPECENTSCFESFNLETKERKSLLDFGLEREGLNSYVMFSDGTIAILYEEYVSDDSGEMGETKYTLKYYDEKYNEKSTVDINELLKLKSDAYLGSIMADNNDNILFSMGEKELAIIGKDGSNKGIMKFDDYVGGYVVQPDNHLIVACYGESGNYIVDADIETLEVGDKILGEDAANMWYGFMDGNGVYDFLSRSPQSLYAYDSDNKSLVELLKWMDCGIIGDNVESVIPLPDGRFICLGYDEGGNRILFYLKEKDADSSSSKSTIKIMLPYNDSSIQQKVLNYNKENPDCKVEIITFDDEIDGFTAMISEITMGNTPDIINVSNVDIENYIAKGILEDLSPYIQKDEEYNEQYFVDGLLDATKKDGKQYYVMDSFVLITTSGKKSELGKFKKGWTMSDLIEYYNSKPEGTKLSAYNTREEVLYTYVLHDLNQYIDWNTGEVKFDTEEFKNVLEFCKKFPEGNNVDMEMEDATYQDIKSGKLLLLQNTIGSTEDIQLNKKLFNNDDFYVGFPRAEGIGTYISPNTAYGICSSSENKEKAWDIIKYLLEPEMVRDENGNETDIEADSYGIPASAERLEKRLEKEMATKKYTDENGEEVYPRESTYTYGDVEIKLGPATEDEVRTLDELIKNSSGMFNYNNSITMMLQEDIIEYLDGKKGLDETVKIIQDKMSKYVNENK